MRILIFGASGGTGRQLVRQSLARGHAVTAFVRNPASLVPQKNLTIFTGNLSDSSSVAQAIIDQDVVMSVLGNKTRNALWESNTVISDGLQNILAGMKKKGVQRLLFVASFGVNEHIFWPEKLFIRIVLKNIFSDIPRQEELIKKSGLDWTIVHPARLTNDEPTGTYHAAVDLPIGLSSHISRADVAEFLLKSISDKKTIGKTITISY